MVTMTASQLISKRAHAMHCSAIDSKPRMFQKKIIADLKKQGTTYHGLRSQNQIDLLRMRATTKPNTKQATKCDGGANMRPWAVIVCGKGMNLVFVGAEMAPWRKTGGLGDVLGGLPPAMAVKVGDRYETVRFFHCYKRGVDHVFIDHPMFLEKAALEAPRVLFLNNSQFYAGPYGEDVVFIANDWHTAPLPCYLKSIYKPDGIYRSAKGRKINWMKAGILESDTVLTVSPYYAQELISGEQRGVELDDTLRKSGVTGIVNGMDVNEWNPSTDKYISVKYDASSVTDAKPVNKEALQAAVGLPVSREIPLIAFIGRLEEQKGSDILVAALPEILDENVQVIVLGTGKEKFETQLESIEETFPQKVRAVMKFNAPLAHQMMAGADIVVVPSRFEPCGLIQLQAMQYGTPTACASTGGLVDTVKDGKTGFHMGLLSADCEAVDPTDVKKVVETVKRAVKAVGSGAFKEMIRNCMAQDLSWKGPAKQWEGFLLSLNVAGSEPGITGEEIAPLARKM